ncbi:MAG: DUF3299 domain-containing protein [Bacteroidia bacterium]|nr:DUF3299 domain-containing protein [Bacteroidia bacterium]
MIRLLCWILGCVALNSLSSCRPGNRPENTPETAISIPTVADSADTTAADPTDNPIILTWNDLKDVRFEEKYYEKEEAWMLFPSFGNSIKTMEGKIIEITGYVIPIEPERYALSANPFSACFFCGNAGPESVMELELQSYGQMYYTDEFRTFRGKFSLNITNLDKMNYVLREAEPVE